MVKKILCQGYLWLLLLLLYAPIFIIMIYSFTEAKVLGNWTGFSTKLYSSLFVAGTHHSLTNALVNTLSIALIAATVSTLLGSITAIGIFNLRTRARKSSAASDVYKRQPVLVKQSVLSITFLS